MQQRILVIDDESVVGLSIQRTLAPGGHTIDVYQDPQAGLQAALAGGYDVIFLDLMLPGANGLELLARIKAASVSSEVVIITGHSTVETAVEAMKRGAYDFLMKPVMLDHLELLLKRALSDSLRQLQGIALNDLLKQRHERIMGYGKFKEVGQG